MVRSPRGRAVWTVALEETTSRLPVEVESARTPRKLAQAAEFRQVTDPSPAFAWTAGK